MFEKSFSIFYFTWKKCNHCEILLESKFIDRKIFSEKSSAKKNVNWTSNAPCYIERVATCMKDESERERGTISDTVCYSINSVRLKSAAVTGSLCRVVAISRLFFVREKQVRRHGIDRSFDISRTSSLGHRVEWGSSMNAPFSRIYWRARVPIFPFRDVTKLFRPNTEPSCPPILKIIK